MSDDQDASQKTEEPTGKKLEEAARKGQVPRSQEVNHWFMITAGTLVVVIFSEPMARRLTGLLLPFLESPHDISTDPARLILLLGDLSGAVALLLLPAVLLLAAAAVAGNLVQNKPMLSAEKLKPKLSKISPMNGLKRIFSWSGIMEFGKGLLKLAIVASVALFLVLPPMQELPLLIASGHGAILGAARDLCLIMLAGVAAVMVAVAAADLFYQNWNHIRELRMTKQEVRDETKQSEGDPMVKARIKSLRLERTRRRMMAAVPGADVVVTNPTHFAVALKYEHGSAGAPRVVAKGQDLVAQKIRELAQSHQVPIVENPPLARALHASCDLDQEIPVEHYQAVAEIIGYVMRLRRQGGR